MAHPLEYFQQEDRSLVLIAKLFAIALMVFAGVEATQSCLDLRWGMYSPIRSVFWNFGWNSLLVLAACDGQLIVGPLLVYCAALCLRRNERGRKWAIRLCVAAMTVKLGLPLKAEKNRQSTLLPISKILQIFLLTIT